MSYKYLFLGFALLNILACEKVDVPDPEEVPMTEPVFYSELNLGDSPFNTEAGQDNFIMDADFKRDPATGLIDLIGHLKSQDCTDRVCARSLKIVLRERARNAAGFDIDQALSSNSFEYAWSYQRDSAVVKFEPDAMSLADATVITWKFDDEKEIRNHRVVEKVLRKDQDYLVRLVLNQQSCMSSQLQTINLTTNGCRSMITLTERVATVHSSGTPPFKYQWTDGTQDSVIALSAISASNEKRLGVKVIDSEGCLSEVILGYSPGTGNDRYCQSAFSYESRLLTTLDQEQRGKVFIEISKDNGELFRSNGFQQPRDAGFEILEVSDFENNDRGQKTKKIKARINCLLSQKDHPEREIKLSGMVVFAIAYPG